MNKTVLAIVGLIAAGSLAACGESPADQAAEKQADALEAQAAATSNEAAETALNHPADAIEQLAGNADGGLTTSNTPTTDAPATVPATK